MDLLSLVLTLRSIEQPASPDPLPLWWGRSAHALLLNVVRQYNPPLAESLHEGPTSGNSIRPFTASTLMGRFSGDRLDLQEPYILRLTAFQEELSAILWEAARTGPLSPGSTVELDFHQFRIESLSPGEMAGQPIDNPPSLWAGATAFQDLASDLLLAKRTPPRHVSLLFTSPTTFKSGGKHVPIPLPELVIGSLLERWNAFAPITFPEEARRYAGECLAVSRYQLSSRPVPQKSGGLRVGGVGEITYTSVSYDRYWMSVIGALAAFALYSGVGAGTTQGLGQCRHST